ncbi:Fe-S protein assembly co-chaperone HscB [Varunaivibrio sulfuroxidans]|uniref:Co-chaperone protein HscB homolog n=1 Tax=Varunaivibrio sulfuroxidans TaxID=1773489 RepID=A0A4R3JBZ8_9PROT|nr:Fe-S protein assembly co-chaperone HscB [Varunaivibrio sulfuroxidans]TCS62170.1 molecular chaperone HscB [Varunaivibrio sulfuroxidans]WES30597.1 Fe-S protein assembly co-chaperone HscB [Varunaivibrio sulfuroxidans]
MTVDQIKNAVTNAAVADRAPAVVACWSCHGPLSVGVAFCPTCAAVQPPGAVDPFTRLGLPMTFDVDLVALDRVYFDWQRKLHPDRFAGRTGREKMLSQQQAVSLNEAYETIKNPLKRADCLVHLLGVDVAPEGCNLVNDPHILMETMEVREALSEAGDVAAVDAIAAKAKAETQDVLTGLSKAFAGGDIEGACSLSTRLKYLMKLKDEIRARRAQLAQG